MAGFRQKGLGRLSNPISHPPDLSDLLVVGGELTLLEHVVVLLQAECQQFALRDQMQALAAGDGDLGTSPYDGNQQDDPENQSQPRSVRRQRLLHWHLYSLLDLTLTVALGFFPDA